MSKVFSTGSRQIDELLDGGLHSGRITHFYGESGSGKTTIGLQCGINCVKKGFLCVYIASDRFPSERFKQLINYEDTASDFYVFETKTFNEQSKAINKIPEKIRENEKELGLVIVDSLTSFYNPRSVEKEERIELKKELINQLIFLVGSARRMSFSLGLLNQVYEDIDTGELRPRGGRLVKDVSSRNVELKKTKGKKRLAILREPSLEPIDSVAFEITESGVG